MLLLISVNTGYRKRPYNVISNKGKVKSYRNIPDNTNTSSYGNHSSASLPDTFRLSLL